MTQLPDGFLTDAFAHRGYHDAKKGCIENSRAAFAAAVEAGYGIEMDLQLSSDGHAMVFHDYELSRLTDKKGAARTFSHAELTRIGLKGCDETIPDLPEILNLVAGRVPLLIELKDQDGAMGGNIGTLEQSVAEALAHYTGPAAVMSFNPHSIAKMAELSPQTPRGLVTCYFPAEHWPTLNSQTRSHLRTIPDYERLNACFVSHRHDDLDNPRLTELKAAGASINCWTVRSVEQEAEARKIADTVTFENYPAEIHS